MSPVTHRLTDRIRRVPAVRRVGTPTIIVSGQLHVDPAERRAYLETCEAVVQLGRRTEGCLDFAISSDLVDPGRVNVV